MTQNRLSGDPWAWRSDMDAPQNALADPALREYHPNILDYAARLITNGQNGPASRAAEVVLGTRGLGPNGYPSIGGVLGANGAAMAGQDLYEGNYGSAALHGAEAVINPLLAGRVGPAATNFAFAPRGVSENFKIPFTMKDGLPGYVSGNVAGKNAKINEAFIDVMALSKDPALYNKWIRSGASGNGDAGAREILRTMRTLKNEYPAVERVTAMRIPNKNGNPDRDVNLAITPEWKRGLSDLPGWLKP